MGVDAKILVKSEKTYTEREIRQLSCRLMNAVGQEHFMIDVDGRWGEPHSALSVVSVYEQDGPDIEPEAGQTLIEAHLFGRYYGPGYERGDWPVLRGICEWLQHNVGYVWYGGDSSGICAERYIDVRDAIDDVWLTTGTMNYLSHFGNGGPECSVCLTPTWNDGCAKRRDTFRCYGCKRRIFADGSLVPDWPQNKS